MFLNSCTENTCSEVTRSETATQGDLLDSPSSSLDISLQDFVSEFGDEMLDSLIRARARPVYTGRARAHHQSILAGLKRQLFPAQADVVHAVIELLINRGEHAAIVSDEMGCGFSDRKAQRMERRMALMEFGFGSVPWACCAASCRSRSSSS